MASKCHAIVALAVIGAALADARKTSAQDVSVAWERERLELHAGSPGSLPGILVSVGIPLRQKTLVVEYDRLASSTRGNTDTRISSFGVGARWSATSGRFRPFAEGLFGAISVTETFSMTSPGGYFSDTSSDGVLMLQAGVGLAVPLARHAALMTRGDYRLGLSPFGVSGISRAAVGVRFTFK